MKKNSHILQRRQHLARTPCEIQTQFISFSWRGSLKCSIIILIVGVRCPRSQREQRSGKKVGSVKTSGVPIFSRAGDLPFTCRAAPDLHPASSLTVNSGFTSRLSMTFQNCGAQAPVCLICIYIH